MCFAAIGFICRGSRALTAVTVLAVPLAALACAAKQDTTTGPVDPNPLCALSTGPGTGSNTALVAIRNFAYGPDTVRVKAGTTVTWVNCEQPAVDPHTVTSDSNVWESLSLKPGDTFAFTFNQTGEFAYTCVPHPFMHGVVIVE
jgi:plastocyanin